MVSNFEVECPWSQSRCFISTSKRVLVSSARAFPVFALRKPASRKPAGAVVTHACGASLYLALVVAYVVYALYSYFTQPWPARGLDLDLGCCWDLDPQTSHKNGRSPTRILGVKPIFQLEFGGFRDTFPVFADPGDSNIRRPWGWIMMDPRFLKGATVKRRVSENTSYHGCCWETFFHFCFSPTSIMVIVGKHFKYIFVSCGLVVELQPLNC